MLKSALVAKNQSLTLNVSQSPRLETIVVINCVLNVPLMLIAIVGNSLVLAAILRTPSLRSPSTVFLCSLAVSDLLVGLVVQPVYIADAIKPLSLSVSIAEDTMTFLLCGVSLCTIATISVDRFLTLHYHMRYSTLMTSKRATYTAAALWFICLLFSLLSFWNTNVYDYTLAVVIAICIILSTFSYTGIYRIVRQHQLQIHAQQQAVHISNAERDLNMVRSTRSAISTFIFYIFMIFCYSPALIATLNVAISGRRGYSRVWVLADTLVYMNSSINPILYCWRLRELRTAIMKTLKYILCNQRGEN